MKLRLLILLAAAALAAPAAGQTVKSLGYNTTNGNIVAATNVTFTNSVGFATNARAATRTNLGATTVGNSVFTATNGAAAAAAIGLGWVALTNPQSSLYSGTVTQLLGYVAETNPSGSGLTGFNVMAYTNTNTLVIPANILIAEDAVPAPRNPRNVTVNGSVTIQYPYSSLTTIYANNSITATDGSTYTNTLVTYSSNAATFATNVSVGGTLTATGNATLNGLNNIAPSQTTNSASSLMTRDLSDARYTTSVWLTGSTDNQTITNGGFKLLGPSRINSFSLGYGASVPSGFTQFRVVLGFGWLQNPATNSTNFPVFVQFENKGLASTTTVEAEHGAAFSRTSLYPTNAASTGLAGTLTRRAVFNTTNTAYSFISDWITIPSAWQSNAASNGFYHVIGAAIANNTGESLTDGFNANHAAVGLIEFRK